MHALEQTDPLGVKVQSILVIQRNCWCSVTRRRIAIAPKGPDQPSCNCSIVSECEFPAGTRKRWLDWLNSKDYSSLRNRLTVFDCSHDFPITPSFLIRLLIGFSRSSTHFRFSKIVGGYTITYPPAKIKKLSKGETELASKDPNVTYKVPIAIVF